MIPAPASSRAVLPPPICGVIVSYNPSAETIENIAALLTQVRTAIVVDNGSASDSVLTVIENIPDVTLIRLSDNIGIAAALNIGVAKARADGFEWIATFDQDSKVTPRMLDTMWRAYIACPNRERIALLCPRYQDRASGVVTGHAHTRPEDAIDENAVLVTMTSGNLMRADIFDHAGHFNEALFIDYVDYEFCLRCADRGYQTLEVPDAILLHSVGAASCHRFAGRDFFTSNHNAIRRYYGIRNRIWLYRHFSRHYPRLLQGLMHAALRELLTIIFFEERKIQKLVAIAMGFRDGLRGKLGRYVDG